MSVLKKISSASKWIRYSGIWVGFVLNPFHWSFGWKRSTREWPDDLHFFDNAVYFGPVWIRLIIDDGRW